MEGQEPKHAIQQAHSIVSTPKPDKQTSGDRHDGEIKTENLEKILSSGYAEPVPKEDQSLQDQKVWYLQHHAVVIEAKPGKVCLVFDCAAKQNGVSLNNQCIRGREDQIWTINSSMLCWDIDSSSTPSWQILKQCISRSRYHPWTGIIYVSYGRKMTQFQNSAWLRTTMVECGAQVRVHLHFTKLYSMCLVVS